MIDFIKKLLQNKPTIDEQLFEAVNNNDYAEVKNLIEGTAGEKADPNIFSDEKTPLHIAIEKGFYDIADYLKEQKGTERLTMIFALKNLDTDMVHYLFLGKDINHQWSDNGETIVHLLTSDVIDYGVAAGWLLEFYGRGANVDATMWDSRLKCHVKASDIASPKLKPHLKQLERMGPLSEPISHEKENLSRQQNPQKELAQMTPEQLEKALRTNEKMLERLMIAGLLADAFKVFPYAKSMEIYKEILPKMDDKNRVAVETVIRKQREWR